MISSIPKTKTEQINIQWLASVFVVRDFVIHLLKSSVAFSPVTTPRLIFCAKAGGKIRIQHVKTVIQESRVLHIGFDDGHSPPFRGRVAAPQKNAAKPLYAAQTEWLPSSMNLPGSY